MSGARSVVLVVDDDPTIRRLLCDAIRDEFPAARVVEAGDGAEALRLARRLVPRLILLDWMLPKQSGDGVVQRLRADPALAVVPVIGISAVDCGDGPLAGLCDAFLRKPFDLEDVLRLVGRHVPRPVAG